MARPNRGARAQHLVDYLQAPTGTPVFFRGENWEALVASLQPGDNLLSVNPGTGPAFAIAYDGFPFTHLARVVDPTRKLVEALRPGVVLSNLDRYRTATFAITRWKGITPDQQTFLAQAARDLIGTGYGGRQLSWLLGRGILAAAVGPLALTGHLGWAVGSRITVDLMNRRNFLDQKNRVICSSMARKTDREANEAGLLPRLPVERLGATEASTAPAHYAHRGLFDWIVIHDRMAI